MGAFISCKWIVQKDFNIISASFQNLFVIATSKAYFLHREPLSFLPPLCWCARQWFLYEKECSFYTHLFCCTKMRWLFISITAIWVTSSDTGSDASRAGYSRARTELTSSKCDWTRIWAIWNVDETSHSKCQAHLTHGHIYDCNRGQR